MQERTKSEMKILSSTKHIDLFFISGQMVVGDVYEEISLICQETGGKWSVCHKSYLLRSELLDTGFRLISLEHIQGSNDLEEGFTLVSEHTKQKE